MNKILVPGCLLLFSSNIFSAVKTWDGGGKTDLGIFRPVSHDWYSLRGSNATVGISNFGQAGDLSIPSAFVP